MIEKIKVSKPSNSAVIQVDGQTYITIHDAKGTLVFSDKSNTGAVNPLLEPGEYVIETDGKLKSIKISKKGGQDLE